MPNQDPGERRDVRRRESVRPAAGQPAAGTGGGGVRLVNAEEYFRERRKDPEYAAALAEARKSLAERRVAIARIPVEFSFNEELATWHFRMERPPISGGGQGTFDAARQAAVAALALALAGEAPRGVPDDEVEYLEIIVN